MKCSICGKEINGKGNNPAPLQRGKCCDECNIKKVMPIRMFLNGMNQHQLLVLNTDGTFKITEKMNEAPLKLLQDLVGGYITLYPSKIEGMLLICDEEGLLKRREPNELAYEILGINVVGNLVLCPQDLFK